MLYILRDFSLYVPASGVKTENTPRTLLSKSKKNVKWFTSQRLLWQCQSNSFRLFCVMSPIYLFEVVVVEIFLIQIFTTMTLSNQMVEISWNCRTNILSNEVWRISADTLESLPLYSKRVIGKRRRNEN